MKIKLDEMDIECTVDEFLELVSRKKKASIGKEREIGNKI